MADQASLDRWRREFQELYDLTTIREREQFYAWFEEARQTETKNTIAARCLADILSQEQTYFRLIKELPKPAEFSDHELENRTGKVTKLYDITAELSRMQDQLREQIEKLRYLQQSLLQ